MIHKQFTAMAIAFALLLVVYSIATATNWQDQAQLLISDPQTPDTEPNNSISMTSPYKGHVSPQIDRPAGAQVSTLPSEGITSASSSGEIRANAIEDVLSPAWLAGWMAQGITALVLLTLFILGCFWLFQRLKRV